MKKDDTERQILSIWKTRLDKCSKASFYKLMSLETRTFLLKPLITSETLSRKEGMVSKGVVLNGIRTKPRLPSEHHDCAPNPSL